MRIYLILILSLWTSLSFSQSFSGTILNGEDNQPIPFVSIYFPDLQTGTTTDGNGRFQLDNYASSNIHIQISCIGFITVNEIVKIDSTRDVVFYLERDHFELEEIVVSASTGKLQGENIVHVDHKKIEYLLATSPITLSEAISNIPGVEQNTTGSGIGKPVIRGLSGSRIVTYAHGTRIENQQWGDEHGLGVGEIGIESVEVIKGPASLLYGSDALGGVLYFIDERYAKNNTIEGYLETKFLSNTTGTINDIGLKINKKQLKFNLFGGFSSQADYKTPKKGRVYNTRFDERNIKSSVGFSTKNWISNMRYSYLRNGYGIVEDTSYSQSGQRKFILPFQTIDHHNLSLDNTFFANNSKLNLILGYANNYRKEFEDDQKIQALGLKLNTYTYNLKWYTPTYDDRVNFVIGSQGMLQTNKNNGEEILIPDAHTSDIGVFALTNITLGQLQLQGGIRGDYRVIDTEYMETADGFFPALNEIYSGVTYSTGGVYSMNKIKFRVNLSSGFRAPNTSELLSDGVHEGTNRYEKGNAFLKNENAVQLDFSFDYKDNHFSFGVNPFYNVIKNYIFLSPTGSQINGDPVFEFLQTKAFLFGGEFGLHYHPHKIHWLHFESNLSTVWAEDTNGNSLPLIPQTKINSTVSAEITKSGKIHLKNIFLQHIYKFKQDRIGLFETTTKAYHLINIGLNLEVTSKNRIIDVNTGIKNLLNTTYIDHLSRFKILGIPNQGVNFYLGLKLSLNER